MILEMEEDTYTPIILGRHSWPMQGAISINVKNGMLSLDGGNDDVQFNLLNAAKLPSISNECNKIDVVDGLIRETISNLNSNDPFKHLMLNNRTTKDENPDVAEYDQLLEASPPIPPSLAKEETLQDENKPSSDEAKVFEVELKPLPSSLRYVLGPKSIYPVIVNASLNATQIDSLLRVLGKHRKAIGS